MATLYEITGDFLKLLDMAEELDEEVFRDTLEGIEGELEIKADGYAKVIAELENREDGLDREIKRLTDRKKAIGTNISRIKGNLEAAMIATGKKKFKTDLFSFGIQKNPPRVVLDKGIEDIPMDYYIFQDPVADKEKIKAELKAGEKFDFAHLEQDEKLRIK